jgi:uracil-DNA glycosylase
MGFCYPGVAAGGGDAPPRPECAPLWHAPLRARLKAVRLTLLVGLYAQKAYLPKGRWTLADAVRGLPDCPQGMIPLPHPSWRSIGWMRRNPWFESETLPMLRDRVMTALAGR